MKARISPAVQLRAQRQRAAAAVVEGVHLLRHDVGGLPDPAGEDARCPRTPASRRSRSRPARSGAVSGVADGEEPRRVRRQGVERALRGARAGRLTSSVASLRSRGVRRRPSGLGQVRVGGPLPADRGRPGRGRAARRSRRPAAGRRRAASAASRPTTPPGRSVRPTEPANSTSPASSPRRLARGRAENIDRALGVARARAARSGRTPASDEHRAVVQRRGRRDGSGSRTPPISGGQRRAVPARRVASMPKSSGCR